MKCQASGITSKTATTVLKLGHRLGWLSARQARAEGMGINPHQNVCAQGRGLAHGGWSMDDPGGFNHPGPPGSFSYDSVRCLYSKTLRLSLLSASPSALAHQVMATCGVRVAEELSPREVGQRRSTRRSRS